MIEKKLADNDYQYRVLPTEASGEYSFLKEKIEKENITDVIICGGDGTVNQVTSYLCGSKANAGIIPLGSGNGLAFAAGIPRNPEKAMDIILAGKSSLTDAYTINGRFSCMLCGLGFDAQVAHDFSKQKKRGLKTYIKLSSAEFFRMKAYPFEITANDHHFKTDAFFISIANSNQFGNHFTIAPKASLSDGLLDIVIANKSTKFGMMMRVLHQLRFGKLHTVHAKRKTIHYFQAKKLTILNPGNAPFHIDGEPVETSEKFEVEILEKAFQLLVK